MALIADLRGFEKLLMGLVHLVSAKRKHLKEKRQPW